MNFMFRWRLTHSATKGLVNKPENRREAARMLIEGFGGKLLQYFNTYSDNEMDGFAITEIPDGQAAAALTMAARATGAFESFEMMRLFTPEEAEEILQQAKKSPSSYTPPGG